MSARDLCPSVLAGAVCAFILAACGDGSAPQAGFETGPCIQGACGGGLECVADVCVLPDGDASGAGSGSLESTGAMTTSGAATVTSATTGEPPAPGTSAD